MFQARLSAGSNQLAEADNRDQRHSYEVSFTDLQDLQDDVKNIKFPKDVKGETSL